MLMADQNRSNFTAFAREKREHVEEEPDQRGQHEFRAHLLLHKETMLTVLCLAFFAVLLSFLFFFTTRSMFILFLTLGVALLLYSAMETHFNKTKRTRP
jgi:L-asparagine transporter-like permease